MSHLITDEENIIKVCIEGKIFTLDIYIFFKLLNTPLIKKFITIK